MSEMHVAGGPPERILRVVSEDDAFNLLERALAGKILDAVIVDFVGWPKVEVSLPKSLTRNRINCIRSTPRLH